MLTGDVVKKTDVDYILNVLNDRSIIKFSNLYSIFHFAFEIPEFSLIEQGRFYHVNNKTGKISILITSKYIEIDTIDQLPTDITIKTFCGKDLKLLIVYAKYKYSTKYRSYCAYPDYISYEPLCKKCEKIYKELMCEH